MAEATLIPIAVRVMSRRVSDSVGADIDGGRYRLRKRDGLVVEVVVDD